MRFNVSFGTFPNQTNVAEGNVPNETNDPNKTIALIVTIIVLLILAGVTIATLTGDSGVITKAEEAKISTELARYKEELELYKIEKYNENVRFEEETLTAGKSHLNYNTRPSNEEGNIKTIIEDIRDGVLWSANGNLGLLGDNTGSLTIPDSVTAIGEGAFSNVEGLKTIIIPSTVKRIRQDAFRYNSTLEEVIMQEKINADGTIEGVEKIRYNAFYSCQNLKTIKLPSTLKTIDGTAFVNCPKLSNIEIPESNKNFEFKNGILLGKLEDDKREMTIILESAIKDNTLTVPDKVVSLKSGQIDAFTQITTVKIPKSVENIEAGFFHRNITNIEIDDANPKYEVVNNAIYTKESYSEEIEINENNQNYRVIEDGGICNGEKTPALYNKAGNVFISPIKPLGTIQTYEIPEKVEIEGAKVIVTEIFNNAFHNQFNMTNIQLPNKIEKINLSFNYCNGLTKIEIPSSIKEISSSCFNDANNLKEIRIHKKRGEVTGDPWGCIYGDKAIIWDN